MVQQYLVNIRDSNFTKYWLYIVFSLFCQYWAKIEFSILVKIIEPILGQHFFLFAREEEKSSQSPSSS